MTHLLITPWQHRAMGELLDKLERQGQPRAFMHKSQLIMYDEFPVAAQRDPPRPRHHDHLIQRHIRAPIRK